MKKINLVFILLLSLHAFAQRDGDGLGIDTIGNGGNVVVCFQHAQEREAFENDTLAKWEEKVRSISLFDFKSNLALKTEIKKFSDQQSNQSWQGLYHSFLNRWLGFKQSSEKENVLYFLNQILPDQWLEKTEIPSIEDHDLVIQLSPNCSRVQMARRLWNSEAHQMEIWINSSLWNHPLFDNIQKAYLAFHESVFYYLRYTYGESISAKDVYKEGSMSFLMKYRPSYVHISSKSTLPISFKYPEQSNEPKKINLKYYELQAGPN